MDRKAKIIIGVLAAAVVILAGFIIYGYYTGWMATQQHAFFMAGYQQGASDAIVTIIQRSQGCQIVPLTAGNQTFGFVDVGCLQQANQTAR